MPSKQSIIFTGWAKSEVKSGDNLVEKLARRCYLCKIEEGDFHVIVGAGEERTRDWPVELVAWRIEGENTMMTYWFCKACHSLLTHLPDKSGLTRFFEKQE